MTARRLALAAVLSIALLVFAACNLTGEPEQEAELTGIPTSTPTFEAGTASGVPTGVAVTTLPILTQGAPPTSIAAATFVPPTAISVIPTATPSTIAIVILSPIPGNVVSQNVQILGSAIHPNFVQYQLEFGPDPNPANLWYTIGAPRLTTVLNGVLGIWATNTIPDGNYQLRLRVYLRDGSNPQTVVNNIRVQNSAPTPVPTATSSIPRPIAAFSVDRNIGEPPLVVRFTNRSTGQISGYSWNFGDGSSSAEANPTHVFSNVGDYEVRLTVVGPGGQSNVSQIISVRSNPPVASFTQNPSSGPAPLTVQFTDTSTGNMTEWRWEFGDGTTSNERSPRHVYSTQGTYNVILRVRGPGGTARAYSTVVVANPQVPPPTANFTPRNTGGNAPLSIQFTDTSPGQITSRLWEFGDGTTSNDQNPIHQFVNPGTYTVRLTVNGPGGTSSITGTVNVTRAPQAPDAAFSAQPTSGNAPLRVQFTNQTTGDATGYRWNFGDGTAIETSQSPAHTFQQAGTYTVRLTALGPNNLSDTAEATINVTQPQAPPQANFSASPTEGSAPLDVTFTNLSSGDSITSTWDFGDGQTLQSNESSISHRYENNGTFTVRLNVTGPGGPASTATRQITVTDRVQAGFDVAYLTDPPGLGIALQDRSTGNIATRAWDFGDGSTSNDRNPTHTYQRAGTYRVTLTVTSTDNVTDSRSEDVTVSEPLPDAPIAGFTATVNNLTVSFTSTSTGQIDSYAWDFGDGSTSSDQNPVHEYSNSGTYTVRLTVGNAGGSNTAQQDITVTPPLPQAPQASFTFSVNNLEVRFTDTSTGRVDTRTWDFGDGSSSSDQNPVHEYTNSGTYTVRLTVGNAGGSTETVQQVEVSLPLPDAPVSSFTFTVENLTVRFTDTSTGQGITSWFWEFGDGNTSNDRNPVHEYGAAGTYRVRLTVENPGGSNRSGQDVTVTAPLPDAPVSSFTFAVDNLTVRFTDTSTGQVETWAWDFGDGSTSTERNPVRTYGAAGTYTVRLTVSNAGGSNESAQQVTVTAPLPQPPQAAFTFTVENQTVTFTDTSTGQVDTWAWDFGDGQFSSERNPVHPYAAPGTYTVRLTVSNAGGATETVNQVTVTAPLPDAPVSSFTFTVDALTVRFTETSTGEGITSWFWEFGDGNTSNERNPVHSYGAAGTYRVRLTVENPGGSDRNGQDVTVTAPLPAAPVSSFTFAVENQTVTFTDTSTGQVDTWAWDFGDGQFSGERNPIHPYAAPGTYTVRLTVSNAGGANESAQQVTVIAPPPQSPQAAFTFSVENQTVTFTDTSTGQVDTWAWDFGDGQFSGEQNPVHPYAAPGTYTVRLTVSNAGGTNETQQPVTVTAAPPDAPQPDFSYDAEGLTATFTNLTAGADSYLWEFGDGGTSDQFEPQYTYGAGGTFTVRLTASNAGGSNFIEHDVTVEDVPVAEDSIADTTAVEPNINELANGLSNILNGGEMDTSVFVVIGDRSVDPRHFLAPFGDGSYELSDTGEQVAPVIEHYLAGDIGDGTNPFEHVGETISQNALASDFNEDGDCGDTVVACELDETSPAITIISVGYRDARDGTDPDTFRAELDEIVNTVIDHGSIPVLLTPFTRPGEENQMRRISEIVIEVADDNDVPVVNVWRMFNELAEPLAGNDPSVANQGGDRLGDNQIARYGENARNFYVLRTLQRILQAVGGM